MTCEKQDHSLDESAQSEEVQRLDKKARLRKEMELRVAALAGKHVSDEDMDLFEHAWHVPLNSNGKLYFRRTKNMGGRKRKSLFLHRIIAGRLVGRELNKDDIVDHIDGNTLNNRRDNLRVGNHILNSSNIRLKDRPFRGTSLMKSGKWRAGASFAGKVYYLGMFYRREDAAAAALAKRSEFEIIVKQYIKAGPP